MGVVVKPAFWEVDAKGQLSASGLYLSHAMAKLCGPSPPPLLARPEFEFGFLHRLDVPSSGLILVGLSFEGYAELQWQMHTYAVAREYTVLVHGAPRGGLRRVAAPISDFLPGHSYVDHDAGRPAESSFKVGLHARQRPPLPASFGLAAVAIRTGRRHQIRVHLRHTGHPTTCDERYAPAAVLLLSPWPPR